jgi:hypothetical protein
MYEQPSCMAFNAYDRFITNRKQLYTDENE